jgi:outer membrane protein OmpA-like peptidoglycan-associated protein
MHELAQRAAKRALCPERDLYTLRIYWSATDFMAMAGYVDHRWAFGRSEIALSKQGARKAFELGLVQSRWRTVSPSRSLASAGMGAMVLAGCSLFAPAASVTPAPAALQAYAPTPIAAGKVTQISTKTTGAYWSYCADHCPGPTKKTLTSVAASAPAVAEQRMQKLNVAADVAFGFDSYQLTAKGRAELDRLVATINASSGSKAASIVVVGHTDRLGSDAYNRRLSEQRAQTVKEYLGPIANAESITAQGLGRSDPVTGAACNSVRGIRKLRDCLQPDRRVEINFVAPGPRGRDSSG